LFRQRQQRVRLRENANRRKRRGWGQRGGRDKEAGNGQRGKQGKAKAGFRGTAGRIKKMLPTKKKGCKGASKCRGQGKKKRKGRGGKTKKETVNCTHRKR